MLKLNSEKKMLRYLEFFWIITPPCVFFDVTEIYMMKLLYAHVRVVVFFSVRETRQLVPNTAAGCLGSITRPRNRLVPRLRLLPFVVFLIYHIFSVFFFFFFFFKNKIINCSNLLKLESQAYLIMDVLSIRGILQ
jgi:magnesium-transporting ATPase (P-type)